MGISEYNGATAGVLSDSKGNTVTIIGAANTSATNLRMRMYYSVPASVGASHTFSVTGTGTYPSMSIVAYSGTHASAPLDQSVMTSFSNTTTTLDVTDITPAEDNEVVVTFVAKVDTETSVDGGFSIVDTETTTGNHQGCALAHLIQTTATVAGPVWTWPATSNKAAGIASFKAAAGGAAFLAAQRKPIGQAVNRAATY